MNKLIRNEFRRVKFSQYMITLIIVNVAVMFLAVTSYLILSNQSTKSMQMYPVIPNFELSTVDLAMTLLRAIIIVWEAVLISQVIVNEYQTRTITILYSFPYKRVEIIRAKMAIIFSLILVAYGVSLIVQHVGIYMLSLINPKLLFTMRLGIGSVITAISTVMIGFIPLAVGIKMKSNISVIVASLVIVMATSNSQGGNTGSRVLPIISVVLAIITVIVLIMTVKKMVEEDL